MIKLRFWLALTLLGLWILVAIPVWLLGIGFAGRMVLLPDEAFESASGTTALAVMYLPPIVSVVLFFFHFKQERDERNAADS